MEKLKVKCIAVIPEGEDFISMVHIKDILVVATTGGVYKMVGGHLIKIENEGCKK